MPSVNHRAQACWRERVKRRRKRRERSSTADIPSSRCIMRAVCVRNRARVTRGDLRNQSGKQRLGCSCLRARSFDFDWLSQQRGAEPYRAAAKKYQ